MKSNVCRSIIFCILIVMCSLMSSCDNLSDSEKRVSMYKEVDQRLINNKVGYIFGKEDAPAKVVEYTSFECSDCYLLHQNISEGLKKFIDEGTVKYIFKPINHPKFANDKFINEHVKISGYYDISNVFNRFKDYDKKDLAVIKEILQLEDDVNQNALKINQGISEEITSLGLSKTPTLIINNKQYTEIILSSNEFKDIITLEKEAALNNE